MRILLALPLISLASLLASPRTGHRQENTSKAKDEAQEDAWIKAARRGCILFHGTLSFRGLKSASAGAEPKCGTFLVALSFCVKNIVYRSKFRCHVRSMPALAGFSQPRDVIRANESK